MGKQGRKPYTPTEQALKERDDVIECFRYAMKRRGFSIAKLAEETGISCATLQSKLCGYSEFTLVQVAEIADVLGIEVIL